MVEKLDLCILQCSYEVKINGIIMRKYSQLIFVEMHKTHQLFLLIILIQQEI